MCVAFRVQKLNATRSRLFRNIRSNFLVRRFENVAVLVDHVQTPISVTNYRRHDSQVEMFQMLKQLQHFINITTLFRFNDLGKHSDILSHLLLLLLLLPLLVLLILLLLLRLPFRKEIKTKIKENSIAAVAAKDNVDFLASSLSSLRPVVVVVVVVLTCASSVKFLEWRDDPQHSVGDRS